MTMTGDQSSPTGATMPPREEQRRKQAIARYLADAKIEDLCKARGGSKSWLYKWRDRYQADDPHWAKERTSRPRNTPAKTPTTIAQAVVFLGLLVRSLDRKSTRLNSSHT